MSAPPEGDEYGPYRINPAFDDFPAEAAIVGKILASFGEIEHLVCRNAAQASNLTYEVLKALYRLRSTSSRIFAADALAAPRFKELDLQGEYDCACAMVRTCLTIRNTFAHCMWGAEEKGHVSGLFYTDPQAGAEALEEFDYQWRHVDTALLTQQVNYFALALEWLRYLGKERFRRAQNIAVPLWPKPPVVEPPPLHNPPEKHMPPWLTKVQQAQHLARAQAARGGPPTQTSKQQALDKARSEKKAKRHADRTRDAKNTS